MPKPSFDGYNQRQVVTPRNGTASIISKHDKAEIMLLYERGKDIESAGFVDGHDRLFFNPIGLDQKAKECDVVWTSGIGKGVSYWDVTKTRLAHAPAILLLTAALANGQGRLCDRESKSFLLESAPNDLFEALLDRITESDRTIVRKLAFFLRNQLHPKCYTSVII
jgi:hypothetical protein